ncbi:unnamed protein product [Sphagnum jensenii]|uniref:Uncharacterized protein n=1 Tax=Sphagnum jensenii TaxID=128206 RepID=A0ABP0WUC7_9BRYO
MAGLGWFDWILGLLRVTFDTITQRVKAVHLPRQLPLIPLSHMTCIITGATSGIGLETARHLAKSGAHVVLAVRNVKAAKNLLEEWQSGQEDGSSPLNVEVMEVDLLSLDSVRKFGEAWEARKIPLNVLINNAGIFCMNGAQKLSKDGLEQHMQVNHLAAALLTILLLPSLLRGSPSRVVVVNSMMHHLGFVDPEDLQGGKRRYNCTSGYSDSKLAQILFCHMLQKRLPIEAGVDIIVVNPGEVKTNVARDLPKIIQMGYHSLFILFTPTEGARSVLFCAADKKVQEYARALRGLGYPLVPYFGSDCKPASVAHQAHDMEKAQLVWQQTLKLVDLPLDCIELVLSENDPVEVIENFKVIDSYPEDENEGALDFLMNDEDDAVTEIF